jgi:hypothetical protein
MRFIQMWFIPSERDLAPSVEQKEVVEGEWSDRLLPLVSNEDEGALAIHTDARVYSCLLSEGRSVTHFLKEGRGAYLYVLEGSPVEANGNRIPVLGAAQVTGTDVHISARGDAELLLIDVAL